jgi:hypothetical protein
MLHQSPTVSYEHNQSLTAKYKHNSQGNVGVLFSNKSTTKQYTESLWSKRGIHVIKAQSLAARLQRQIQQPRVI